MPKKAVSRFFPLSITAMTDFSGTDRSAAISALLLDRR
ncbi:hypothetical protein MCETARE7_00999 [Candidatus Nanopelagicaceae bacterium]